MENKCKNLNDHHLALEFDKVLLNLSKYANSNLAKEECLNLEILNNKAQIEYELNLVDLAKKIIDDTQQSAPINNLANINEIFKQNYLTAEEIIELAKNLQSARLTKNFIQKQIEKTQLNEIIQNLYIKFNLLYRAKFISSIVKQN